MAEKFSVLLGGFELTIGSQRLKEYSDLELCDLIKLNYADAFNELLNRYSYLIRCRASKYFSFAGEMEDLYQEGTLGLLNAAIRFDDSFDISFKNFASLCIERKIISYIRSNLKKREIPKDELVSIHEINDFTLKKFNVNIDPVDLIVDKENSANIIRRIKCKLSPFEYKVWRLYFLGYKSIKVAEILSVNSKSVDNALQRIRKKIKNESIMPK